MKVILTQDVNKLGKKDDLVDVSDGYAKNFLFKKGLAVPADAKNMNLMLERKEAEKQKKAKNLSDAKDIKDFLQDKDLVLEVKAGESGRLFGSVTTKDIAQCIKEQHEIDIDRKKIILKDPIKNLGPTKVNIRLLADVSFDINLDVRESKEND